MSNLMSQLTKSEQARLLEELNYMNLEEIRGFCSEHGIPYRILAEYPNGHVKATKDTDRKPIVLARVRRYLATGEVGHASCIPAGRFQDGAVARVVAMAFWTRGQAPAFDEFARSWMKAKAEQHRLLTPEYAYLTDLKHRRADDNWKALRTAKAKSALKTLARIAPSPAAAARRLTR